MAEIENTTAPQPLYVYNTLTKEKELFTPIHTGRVGLYVCGPTVYGSPHLGHARPYITFDILFRYLQYQGYKVRYVRNITDVGHLENDADEGEDKIAKKARLEQVEPMEIAHLYTDEFEHSMSALNNLPVSISPRATGHIIEQIEMITEIINKGLAYEADGSVYFDVIAYHKGGGNYGELSGRVVEDLIAGAGENRRILAGQSEKRNPADFALWKKAQSEHIMKWPSPWSVGFPGWHIECSAMSRKYLGTEFDIHGGGMDLIFPHHEGEIAQCKAVNNAEPVKYWMHCNMLTINGQKMGKSLGNFITLSDLFSGTGNDVIEKAYDPMTIRFFILQAHYRSTLDFSNTGLQAAEKGLYRLLQAAELLNTYSEVHNDAGETWSPEDWILQCHAVMNDDLNTARLISELFEGVSIINKIKAGTVQLSTYHFQLFKSTFNTMLIDILGLKNPTNSQSGYNEVVKDLMHLVLDLRQMSRDTKNWDMSDAIRDKLANMNIKVKDEKEGATWEMH
ncbi:MAG: cysteine--tRNA ligase [Bacteroidota bacterium]|nr:cysteine--tRNA ligase [Bacteroidota bacterium]